MRGEHLYIFSQSRCWLSVRRRCDEVIGCQSDDYAYQRASLAVALSTRSGSADALNHPRKAMVSSEGNLRSHRMANSNYVRNQSTPAASLSKMTIVMKRHSHTQKHFAPSL